MAEIINLYSYTKFPHIVRIWGFFAVINADVCSLARNYVKYQKCKNTLTNLNAK